MFVLDGTGLGSKLTMAVRIGTSSTPVANNGTYLFPNTSVGTQTAAFVDVTNAGNVAAQINSVTVAGAGFLLPVQPPVPASLAAGATLSISMAFAPTTVGQLSGTIQIQDQTINLKGSGTAPPALPTPSFTGLGSTAAPLDQPSVGLSLASTYPFDVTGTLTLTFASASFVDDPAIQFATGGRTVNFVIPANTQTAMFNNRTSALFQAGTVAGTISVTAAFATGNVNITPSPAPVANVSIAASAPVLKGLQVGTTTATSFQLLITGLSTTRSVSQLTLQFTGAPGSNLQTTSLPIPVDSAFSSWYQSTAGQAVGSQFTATITLNVAGNLSAIQTVSVTATNAQGVSNSVSANLN
jgi:hypothetical protein